MPLIRFPAVWMRGGTSKGLFGICLNDDYRLRLLLGQPSPATA